MASNNRERVGKAFDLLSEGLIDVVDTVMTQYYETSDWPMKMAEEDAHRHNSSPRILTKEDVYVQLRAITEKGYEFKDILSRAQQGFAAELRETRNSWAHIERFSSDDTLRALDTIERLLRAVDSPDSADDVQKIHRDLQRSVFEEQKRQKVRKNQETIRIGSHLPSWREIVQPHEDVARGDFTAAEFAADLHLVHSGQISSPEYRDPVEFFNRTYLTEGLRDLLSRALRRLNGETSASPVVNLQTNFGGGKTHSMLALYHLFGGTATQEFPEEVQELIATNNNPDLSSLNVRRVALVGTYLKPGSPIIKEDGTEVHTLWGELAWQLGGREAYDVIAEDDRAGTNPGEALRTLLTRFSPALILIDEWVAYARQLVTDKELPAGSFETQFTFAQSLTEIARSVPGVMLVVSIPASDATGTGSGSDIEIGGRNGQLALDRLQNVIRRVADQWRPSSKDESFEIVRRRLFQDPDAQGITTIGAVARSYVEMYRKESAHFPREATSMSDDYEKRIRASYPLHPELLDRLYEDWSTLERFQRTRGVLKLVSSIVNELWAANDSSPLIMPGTVPLGTTSVNTDLTQYLEDRWKPIIDSDIEGKGATALEIDAGRTDLGKRIVTRRIARTIFFGAAPRAKSTRKGLDKQYVWLGAAIPGDALDSFANAVELLGQRSTYFYEEQGHYWFDTQPSVTKTANDYAERLREDIETVWNEITRRLQSEQKKRGSFDRVHVAPVSDADIPDLEETRMVILPPRISQAKHDRKESETLTWVQHAVESKGSSQRIHRNSLIFLAPDKNRLETLEANVRTYLGWKKVLESGDSLNLSLQQRRQAEASVGKFDQAVTSKIPDVYMWVIYPQQLDPTQPFTLAVEKVSGSESFSLAERVSEKLKRDEQLITVLGAAILGSILNNDLRELWEKSGEITVGQLWSNFTNYIYMPRLVCRKVLETAIEDALNNVLLEEELFAIAVGKNSETERYQGLVIPPNPGCNIQISDTVMLVHLQKAREQLEKDRIVEVDNGDVVDDFTVIDGNDLTTRFDVNADDLKDGDNGAEKESYSLRATRFFGSVELDPDRYSRSFGRIVDEVISRIAGTGVELQITLDIQAQKLEGFTESEVRVINENTQVLKFRSAGFEEN
ncbi:DUF499 domain-containing protein [Arcanobacterium phocisimile]|uniref:DUF499 domain-containing protein n=1 Tax=Arcanobacterium phocisimile TaxID=1302235 RepID=A0ABX7IF54_9ACTO|nr:DUF499 domain-containing protein [Arcanobacterium phocisimile]QRV01768.1 DUF499 domain-containing protein [Arcanobacterium phocisimile]